MSKDTIFEKKTLINCRGKYLDLSIPRIMGILNITPDSFYDGGKYTTEKEISNHVKTMVEQGSDIIDVGAYSSRPGASEIRTEEEYRRLKIALTQIRKDYPEIIISVDTFRSEIVKTVVKEFNVDIINDISGGELDAKMIETVVELKVPYIVMHMPGTPRTMQKKTQYKDIVREIIEWLGAKTEMLKLRGINDLIIDPGFGFGKTPEQNYQLLYHLYAFQLLELPVLVGLSRKSMIYKFLNTSPNDALNATSALNMLALTKGASILRVHDVKEAKEITMLFHKTKTEGMNYLN